MKRLVVIGFALLAVMGAVTASVLPPAARAATAPRFKLAWPVVRGAYHVHSNRSDGTGSLDEIARAAARAGLHFVIVTDHGDGTRAPEPPTYRDGVLCIDGVEISTEDGHYVALDIPQAPYPLGGRARDVIADVRRLGGFGLAAHPGSPKGELQWHDWHAPFDGLEWLNADSEWRDEFWGSLGGVLLTYAFRPVETLVGLLDRPESVLQQWDRLALLRRVPALAGADAHARLGLGQAVDPYQDRIVARLPSYEVSFRAFVNHVILDAPPNGDAARDAALILQGIREGRVFTSIEGLAALSALDVRASSGTNIARPGEYLAVAGPVAIEAQVAAPEGATLALLRDGRLLYETRDPAMRVDVGNAPGAYRVEVHLPGADRSAVPWVLTNPIYVGLQEAHHTEAAVASPPAATMRTPIATAAWQAEASDGSTSALGATVLEDGTPALEWRFALAGGARGRQYAAMRFPLDQGLAGQDRLQLRARSDRPRRVWAQLRAPGPREGERWGMSFYLDGALQLHELRFDEFRPLGAVSSPRPPLDRVDSLLLVIDTLNTAPGAAGSIAITDLWLAR